MMLQAQHFDILRQITENLATAFPDSCRDTLLEDSAIAALQETAGRLQDNLPYHEPFYLGQMLKPPHPVAHLAYTLAMCLNPNNHAYDGGRASSEMEKECVRLLAGMFGWSESLGHLCGGGTIANFEALWVAREMNGGGPVLVSSQAHYTHQRLAAVLKVPCFLVDVDERGRMDPAHLEFLLRDLPVCTVVATAGTTALGAVDPVAELLPLKEKFGFRLHVDAAYGGYFRLIDSLNLETTAAFRSIQAADSIVIDPHKHGLQPYGCGCVLFRDPEVGRVYHHESPYTYFTSEELHLGEISLECSRAGAAAVALWATMRYLPLVNGGKFSAMLENCRTAAQRFAEAIQADARLQLLVEPELDIVVFGIRAESASRSTALATALFHLAAQRGLHLALSRFPRRLVEKCEVVRHWDCEEITCIRTCLMKPEHRPWLPQIIERLWSALDAALRDA